MDKRNMRICKNWLTSIVFILFIYILAYNIIQYVAPRLFMRVHEGMECSNAHINDNSTKLKNLETKFGEYKYLYEILKNRYADQNKTIKSNQKKLNQLQVKCSKCA
tara:strand:- start:4100 stop:4417 length:318 start_codon:yes stop_codon:yes gene_type:complete